MSVDKDSFLKDWLDKHGHTIRDVDQFKKDVYRRYLYFEESIRIKRVSDSSDKNLLDRVDNYFNKALKLLNEYRNRCHSFDEAGIIKILDKEIDRVDLLLLGMRETRKGYDLKRIIEERKPNCDINRYKAAILAIGESFEGELTDDLLCDLVYMSEDIGNDYIIDSVMALIGAQDASFQKGYNVEGNNCWFIGGVLSDYEYNYLPEGRPDIKGSSDFYELIHWCFESLHQQIGVNSLKRYLNTCVGGKPESMTIELSEEYDEWIESKKNLDKI